MSTYKAQSCNVAESITLTIQLRAADVPLNDLASWTTELRFLSAPGVYPPLVTITSPTVDTANRRLAYTVPHSNAAWAALTAGKIWYEVVRTDVGPWCKLTTGDWTLDP